MHPYLLRGVTVSRVNQVWGTDITYIPMAHGFMYLVAIMDWYSRYVLAWRLSNTLDVYFCLDALEEALSKGTPEVFNTDQGSQFTSEAKGDKNADRSSRGRKPVFGTAIVPSSWCGHDGTVLTARHSALMCASAAFGYSDKAVLN